MKKNNHNRNSVAIAGAFIGSLVGIIALVSEAGEPQGGGPEGIYLAVMLLVIGAVVGGLIGAVFGAQQGKH